MAQKVVTSLVDDLDESEASQTIEFSVDRATYEIDLNDTHASELRDALAKYVAAARRLSGRASGRRTSSAGYAATPAKPGPRQGGTAPAKVDREQNQAIREWARKHGAKLGEKGRIPEPISVAFQANDPAAIPDRYLAAKAAPEQPTERATLDIETAASEAPTSTETPEGVVAGDLSTDARLLPDTPRQLSTEQKRTIATWAAEQGMIDGNPTPSKVTKDILAQYKVVASREPQPV